MNFIGKIYRRNIYGVIGTLIFHIILVSLFLLADVDMKGSVKDDVILIEFPNIFEPEEIEEQTQEENSNDDELANSENLNDRTNLASNKLAQQNTTSSTEEFFDEEYMKEIEEAQRLSSEASNQLSKEIVDIKDIEMPVETTEGMERDSIKNVIYSGESNIIYYLENRYHISLPNPLYLSHRGGKIIVDIVVNKQGVVVKATPRKNSGIRDEQIFVYAKIAAMKTIFNINENTNSLQNGSIHYTFIAQ